MSPEPPGRTVLVVVTALGDPPGTDETPLAGAATPALDAIGRRGRAGLLDLRAPSPWDGFLALLGVEPGAAALGAVEALGAGVAVAPGECAWRADFVTADAAGVHDPFAGRIREPEAGALLAAAEASLPGVRLLRLGGHRNLAVASAAAEFAPTPFEMIGRPPRSGLREDGVLRRWFDAAAEALEGHDVNRVRVDLGENPANALWFHGGGPAVAPPLRSALEGRGAVLVGPGGVTEGLARALGATAEAVEGDVEALAAAAIAAVRRHPLVVVRAESVLAGWCRGGAAGRREAVSEADSRLVGPLLSVLEEAGEFTIAVSGDCVLDTRTGALAPGGTPCAVLRSGDQNDGVPRFTENACARAGFHPASAAELWGAR